MSNSMEHSLDDELQAIEKQLANLAPRSLPVELLSRMEQSMGQWSGHEESDHSDVSEGDLNHLEVHLGLMQPAAMPEDMLTRMSDAMDRWQERAHADSSDDKVIPMELHTERRQRARSNTRVFGSSMWTAAAAVALLGAVSALILPRLEKSNQGMAATVSPVNDDSSTALDIGAIAAPSNTWTASDALSHKVTRTSDTGVIMAGDNTPHRCIRVDYVNRIKAKDADGREIEIKSPGVDYVLIPVETN